MFVYLITNLIDGKRYVGQTKQKLSDRWNDHVSKTNCKYLHNAINKHGRENFSMEPICDVPTLELANEFEIEYIKRYCTLFPNGYNLKPGGDEPRPMSEEEREKLRQRMIGNKFRLGIPNSEEQKKKLHLANIGKILSEEHKSKISVSHMGICPSEGTKKRMRSVKLGRKFSEETKERMKLSQQARRLREQNDRSIESACSRNS